MSASPLAWLVIVAPPTLVPTSSPLVAVEASAARLEALEWEPAR